MRATTAVIGLALLALGHAQTCGYIRQSPCNTTDPQRSCWTSSFVPGVCVGMTNSTGGETGIKIGNCQAGPPITAEVTQYAGAGAAMCSGTATPTPFPAPDSRCGPACSVTATTWDGNSMCTGGSGVSTTSVQLYMGGECWNGQKVGCGGGFIGFAGYSGADAATCPTVATETAFIQKQALDTCIPSTSGTTVSSFKGSACTGGLGLPVISNTNVKGESWLGATCNGASLGQIEAYFKFGTCQFGTTQYCYNDAQWSYTYSDTACTPTNLMAVSYSGGCSASTPAPGTTGGQATSSGGVCTAPAAGPAIDITGEVAVATQYSDSSCSTVIGGNYMKTGTCAGNLRVNCTSATAATLEYWASSFGCMGAPTSVTAISTSTCVADPTSSNPTTYLKGVSCGAAPSGGFSPAAAPKPPAVSLSAAGRVSGIVGLWMAVAMVMGVAAN